MLIEKAGEVIKMKKVFCHIVAILLIIPICLCSCQAKSTPEDTIAKLESGLNTYDTEKVLECYEPSVQSMYAGIMEIGGALLGGVDLQTILQGMGGFANIYGDNMMEGGMPKVTITVNSIKEITDDKVLADMTFKTSFNDEEQTEKVYAYLVYIDDTWYFAAETPKNGSSQGGR